MNAATPTPAVSSVGAGWCVIISATLSQDDTEAIKTTKKKQKNAHTSKEKKGKSQP